MNPGDEQLRGGRLTCEHTMCERNRIGLGLEKVGIESLTAIGEYTPQLVTQLLQGSSVLTTATALTTYVIGTLG